MAELKVISKKYNDKDELIVENFEEEVGKNVVPSLVGKDINVNGITSKGIANTGNIANIGDIATTGAITGKTFKQSEANWSEEKTSVSQSSHATSSGLTNEVLYVKLEEVNGILYLVFLAKFKNETESAISVSYHDQLIANFTLPEEVALKIKDYSGKNAHESSSAVISVGMRGGIKSGSSYYENMAILSNNATENAIQFTIYTLSTFSLGAGEDAIYEDRLFLTIL